MPTSLHHEGLIPLVAAQPRILAHLGRQSDPVAIAATAARRLRLAVERRPDLAVRIGWRLYFRDERKALDALASALQLTPAEPKPARAKRAAVSSPQGVAA